MVCRPAAGAVGGRHSLLLNELDLDGRSMAFVYSTTIDGWYRSDAPSEPATKHRGQPAILAAELGSDY
jgi:hypothetical protein